ncbi:MAG: DUF3761 domain-containing protein [Burkholderiales bacterium]|nr:DUF3761 domain-containing protein [Burkholderiales bacterium]
MKYFILALILGTATVLGSSAYADSAQPSQPQSVNEKQLVEHGKYINSDGKQVHSPAHSKDGQMPSGATAKCADGSYSFSQHRRGTCSHHGGVAAWL